MTEDTVRLGIYWILGGIPMALGAWIAFFNVSRHWQMSRIRKSGRTQYISGTPMVGSLFFFGGWWVTPLGFSPWMLLILLAEVPAFITFLPADEPDEATGDSGDELPDESTR